MLAIRILCLLCISSSPLVKISHPNGLTLAYPPWQAILLNCKSSSISTVPQSPAHLVHLPFCPPTQHNSINKLEFIAKIKACHRHTYIRFSTHIRIPPHTPIIEKGKACIKNLPRKSLKLYTHPAHSQTIHKTPVSSRINKR